MQTRMEAEEMDEDMQRILDLLLAALQETRAAADLESLEYDRARQTVTATFEGGGTREINVAMDSGAAMIRDVMKHVGW